MSHLGFCRRRRAGSSRLVSHLTAPEDATRRRLPDKSQDKSKRGAGPVTHGDKRQRLCERRRYHSPSETHTTDTGGNLKGQFTQMTNSHAERLDICSQLLLPERRANSLLRTIHRFDLSDRVSSSLNNSNDEEECLQTCLLLPVFTSFNTVFISVTYKSFRAAVL